MVVITAIVTIIVNRVWLKAPIERPMVATITSVEPRAFMPVPSASDSRNVSPASLPPTKAPPNFPILAIAIRPQVRSSRSVSFRIVRSAERPAVPKKTGMKKAMINPRNCSSI